jgi:DNA-binding response OmpR family regulator
MKRKVLIIDDNHSILEYLKALLSRYNFEIVTCENGYDGLHQVAKFKPDIILLDLMMPSIDGLKLLKLKKELIEIKDIPVIVISANTSRKNLLASIESGADRVLAKPVEVKELKNAIDELLDRPNFEQEPQKTYEPKYQKDYNIDQFIKLFESKKGDLLKAIDERNYKSIKEITSNMLKQNDGLSQKCRELLLEINERHYSKPSDWMFAKMKIQEIEKYLTESIANF